MARVLSILIFLLCAIPSSTRATSAEVSPKQVIEIQPISDELGNMFGDAASQVLSDSGYTWDGQLRGDIGTVDILDVKLLLETGTAGLLLYGSHGGADGTIGAEKAASQVAASARKNDLIYWHRFQPNEISVGQVPSGTWMVFLNKVYTDDAPHSRDVAIRSACNASSGGDFNASHGLASSSVCTNADQMQAYSLLMVYMMSPSYRTLASSQIQITAFMASQGKTNPWTPSGTGDIKFFHFECTQGQRLAVGMGVQYTGCSSGPPPDASIEGFSVVDGVASWYTLFEDGTREYLVETGPSVAGPWHSTMADFSGIGEHSIPIQNAGKDRVARLVEVEIAGGHRVVGIDRLWTTEEIRSANAQVRRRQAPGGHGDEPRSPRESQTKTSGCTSWAAVPDYVIFSVGPLFSTVDCTIGAFRESQGHAVRVIDVDAAATGSVSDFVRTTIRDCFDAFGTKYFHIVGSWEDDFSSQMWQTDDYWLAKRAAYLEARARFGRGSTAKNSIPALLTSAGSAPRTAASTPYVYSDQPYGDLDDDGIPDVVVTRWPFTEADQVQAAYLKLQEYDYFAVPEKALLVGRDQDQEQHFEPALVRFAITDEVERLAEAGPGQTSSQLYWADSDLGAWNVDTADRINSFLPDVIFLLGSVSNSDKPAGCFSKSDVVVPWQMSMLNPFVYARLIVAASCDAADYEDYGQYGSPVCVDFLGEPYLGAMEWIGSTGSTVQAANHLVSVRLIDEMYGHPYRPMAESWLVAMQRAYQDVAASPDFAELLPTLESYVFLGDPIAPLSRVPYVNVSVAAGGSNAPDTLIFGCPAGDGDSLAVQVDFNDADAAALPFTANDVTLQAPYQTHGILSEHVITADAIASGYVATIGHKYITGQGSANLPIYLDGHRLGQKAHVGRRGPDVIGPGGSPPDGVVNVLDFTAFGNHYPPMPYGAASDFDADNDVDNADFARFGAHYNHQSPFSQPLQNSVSSAASTGAVVLEFEEDQPLLGQHVVRAKVTLQGVEPFAACVIALANENPLFQYASWTPDPSFPGTTMCTDVVRDGHKQVFVGIVGAANSSANPSSLGTAEFVVESANPVQLTEHDFELVTGDILASEGALESRGEQLQLSLLNRTLSFSPATYHNELAQNYPNPFNPQTTLAFSLAKASKVELKIFDVRGALVRTLVDERQDQGIHRLIWDGRDRRGQPTASGVYFYRLIAGSFRDTKKMVLIR